MQCEQATVSKNKDYKRMQQRNHTQKAVEEYRTARKEEKRIHKQKKKIFIEREFEELECLRSNNESKSFYCKLNRSRKDFQPRTISCRNKEGMLLSKDGLWINSIIKHCVSCWTTYLTLKVLQNSKIFFTQVGWLVTFEEGISPTVPIVSVLNVTISSDSVPKYIRSW